MTTTQQKVVEANLALALDSMCRSITYQDLKDKVKSQECADNAYLYLRRAAIVQCGDAGEMARFNVDLS